MSTVALVLAVASVAYAAEVRGTRGDDTLEGTNGADVIFALQGDDTVYGLRGKDDIKGAGGEDTLYGGGGPDILRGGNDDDHLYGGPDNSKGPRATDKYFCGAGFDTVYLEGPEHAAHNIGPDCEEVVTVKNEK